MNAIFLHDWPCGLRMSKSNYTCCYYIRIAPSTEGTTNLQEDYAKGALQYHELFNEWEN